MEVIDDIHGLVNERILQVRGPREAALVRQEPRDGHGLGHGGAVPLQNGQLAVWEGGLQGLHVICTCL